MHPVRGVTRRAILRLAAAGLLRAAPLWPRSSFEHRRYRADATVSLFSIPMFSRRNVGGACLLVEEMAAGGSTVTAIQFAAGSTPERTHGLNRFGMTEETVRADKGAVVESDYLSFITTNREQNFEEARMAFVAAPGALDLTVAHGRSTAEEYSGAVEQRPLASSYTWLNCREVFDDLRLHASLGVESAAAKSPGGALPTFLYAVRQSMIAGRDVADAPFVHNAKIYRLRTRRRTDPGTREASLTGWISAPGQRKQTEFRIWWSPEDPGSLPLRIEFHPRSFLKLTFEQDPSRSGPVFRSLLQQQEHA
jgi:hypothetical protein